MKKSIITILSLATISFSGQTFAEGPHAAGSPENIPCSNEAINIVSKHLAFKRIIPMYLSTSFGVEQPNGFKLYWIFVGFGGDHGSTSKSVGVAIDERSCTGKIVQSEL